MPPPAVRTHTPLTSASIPNTKNTTKNTEPSNSAGRKPAITATAPIRVDFHTLPAQRASVSASGTLDQTPQASSSMPAVAATIDATKETGSPTLSADGTAESPYPGRRRYTWRGKFCRDYLAGKCDRRTCKFSHPPEGTLHPCRNFFAGTCNNPRCPRPHITNWGNPYKPAEETEDTSSDEDESPPVSFRPVTATGDSVSGDRNVADNQPEVSHPLPQKPRVVCYNFKEGHCRNGDSCSRFHDLENSDISLMPCMDFFAGICDNPKCPRAHITDWGNPYKAAKQAENSSISEKDSPPVQAKPVTLPDVAVSDGNVASPTNAFQPLPKKSKVICRNFRKGKCRGGDACPRRHDLENPISRDICRDNLRGKCTKGSSCRYIHEAPASQTTNSAPEDIAEPAIAKSPRLKSRSEQPAARDDVPDSGPAVSPTQESGETQPVISNRARRRLEPCRKYLRGKCHRKKCPYSHEDSTKQPDGPTPAGPYETPPESTAIVPDQTVKSGHASSQELCKDYILHGKCPRGNKCPRSHPPRDVWTQYLPAANDICPLFLAGQCREGARCRNRHSTPSAPSSSAPEPVEKNQKNSTQAATPLANRNGYSATISDAKASGSKVSEGLQNVPPTKASTSGKQPQRSPLAYKSSAAHNRSGRVSPSSTCADTSLSVTDEEPTHGTRKLRSQSGHSAPPLTADTSMSSIASELHNPPTPPRTRNEPSDLMKEVARMLEEARHAPTHRYPVDEGARLPTAKGKEREVVGQPKAPVPLFPPGLGIEQQHGVKPEPPQPPTRQAPDTIAINVLDAVTVTFGPGLQVQSLKTGFESNLITLMHIPAATTADAITRLLSKYGEVQNVEMSDPKQHEHMTVKATFSNNEEAARACVALDNNKSAFGIRISAKHASLKSTALGKGFVQDGLVRVEFPAAQKAAYGGYASMQLAEEAIQNARNAWEYECRIDAEVWRGVPSAGGITVKFKGLPHDAPLDFVNRFGPTIGNVIERPNYTGSLEYTGKCLLRHLERCGEVEKVTFMAPPFARQTVVAFARFKTPAGAANACRQLDRRSFPWLGKGMLTLKHMLTIQYALPTDVWYAIKDDVIRMSDHFRNSPMPGWVTWRVGSNRKSPVQVKLCASQQVVLSKLKIAFDAVLRGERVTEDGHWVWDPFFSRAAGIKFIDILRYNHRNVLVNVDAKKRYIALYGPWQERATVRDRILWEVRRIRTQAYHDFPLDGGLVGLFVNADLMKLQEELGHENIFIDPVNQVLKVRGNQDVLKVVRLILQDEKNRHSVQRPVARSPCPVCFDEASLPVTLSCGHTWCKTCFTDYILASVDSRTFPLTCLGNEGKCGLPIPVVTARDLLSSEQFATVARASYQAYIHSRPSEFFYCPTPDCPQIYRSAAPGVAMQCPSCLVRICVRCHVEYHEGTPCVDREREEARLFEQWSRTRDVKNCPGCKTTIERIAGCNHITCAHCKTHICWQCLKTFKESGEVYDHMRSAHGGIGVEEYWF